MRSVADELHDFTYPEPQPRVDERVCAVLRHINVCPLPGHGRLEVTLAGRMHFRGPDQFQGFERRIVGELGATWIGGRGTQMYELEGTSGQDRVSVENSGPGVTGNQLYDQAVTDAAVEFVRQRRPGDRPFCLVVGYVLPHCPYVCPAGDYEYYYDRVSVPRSDRATPHPVMQRWMKRRRILEPLPDDDIRRARAAYYGLVSMLDGNTGRVLDAVGSSALSTNTVIVDCSDHGEMAGEHGLWWRSNLRQESVGVPLIVSWPGHFVSGTKADHSVSLLDVGPTVIELGGAPGLPDTDGRSLVEALRTGSFSDHADEVVTEHFPPFVSDVLRDQHDPPMRMVRRGPWKLMVYHGAGHELFNLEEDPREEHDRSDDPAAAGVLAELLAGPGRGGSRTRSRPSSSDGCATTTSAAPGPVPRGPPIRSTGTSHRTA